MTALQLGDLAGREMLGGDRTLSSLNLKLSFTFNTVEVVAEAPQSPVNLPPAPNLNLQLRNEAAQVEVGIPGAGKVQTLESLESCYQSCLGNTEPSTSTVRLVPLHFII